MLNLIFCANQLQYILKKTRYFAAISSNLANDFFNIFTASVRIGLFDGVPLRSSKSQLISSVHALSVHDEELSIISNLVSLPPRPVPSAMLFAFLCNFSCRILSRFICCHPDELSRYFSKFLTVQVIQMKLCASKPIDPQAAHRFRNFCTTSNRNSPGLGTVVFKIQAKFAIYCPWSALGSSENHSFNQITESSSSGFNSADLNRYTSATEWVHSFMLLTSTTPLHFSLLHFRKSRVAKCHVCVSCFLSGQMNKHGLTAA